MKRSIWPFIIIVLCCTRLWAQPFYFPEQSIFSYECPDCPELSKEPLTAQWILTDMPLFNQSITSHNSYSWQQWITAGDLQKGIRIQTLGKNALIRLTPAEPARIPDNWREKIELHTPAGKILRKEEIGLHSDASLLPINTMAAQKSLMVQMNASVGQGSFKLQIPEGVIPENSRWQLSVFDRYAALYLHAETDKAQYQYGDTLKMTAYLKDESPFEPIESVEAFVNAPSGKTQRIDLTEIRSGVYQGSLSLIDTRIVRAENWDLEVLCHQKRDDKIIVRTAHIIFSYIVPSAKLVSIGKEGGEPLHFKVNLETANPSRYTLQMLLYGYDQNGKLQPAQLSQASEWLEKGVHNISFAFNKELMRGLKEPYEIGHIKLLDLKQLKPVFSYEPLIKVDELT